MTSSCCLQCFSKHYARSAESVALRESQMEEVQRMKKSEHPKLVAVFNPFENLSQWVESSQVKVEHINIRISETTR